MFEQITDASKGKQIVMFLDYDGTLSPIVDDPDQAFMSNKFNWFGEEIRFEYVVAFTGTVWGRIMENGIATGEDAASIMEQAADIYMELDIGKGDTAAWQLNAWKIKGIVQLYV
ncbi:hypothetical protein JRO89_XS04G0140500 [Xanthoceras sorbifolium]|uniref:Uncharacterized protein n=1 Tax=Xanthoceras sorbifolium TaxID=99658 RepID=A0ABQ8I576_9ROSI|nr:hypothetical protein JRO89_XS04G0140500 [Xanthoceras sorbifolium]